MSPGRKRAQFRRALRPLVGAGQDLDDDARRLRHGFEVGVVLPREDRGRRHHHALPARLDRDQQRHERHQRLARAHVALQSRLIRVSAPMSASISRSP
jgi:hypothetical protein